MKHRWIKSKIICICGIICLNSEWVTESLRYSLNSELRHFSFSSYNSNMVDIYYFLLSFHSLFFLGELLSHIWSSLFRWVQPSPASFIQRCVWPRPGQLISASSGHCSWLVSVGNSSLDKSEVNCWALSGTIEKFLSRRFLS